MTTRTIAGRALGVLVLLLPVVGCSDDSDSPSVPWDVLVGVWDVTYDETVDSCWGVEDENLLWQLEQVGSSLLRKEYDKDAMACGDEELIDGIAFRANGDVDFQATLPMDNGGCQETYTVTVVGSWSAAGFQFSVDEQWEADDPLDPDCTLDYPCERQYSITATPSADPFPPECE
jgi:hypothetical protein